MQIHYMLNPEIIIIYKTGQSFPNCDLSATNVVIISNSVEKRRKIIKKN